MILFTQCNSVQISTQDKNNKTDLVTAHNNLPKNESSTYHTFKAAFKGIKYNKTSFFIDMNKSILSLKLKLILH